MDERESYERQLSGSETANSNDRKAGWKRSSTRLRHPASTRRPKAGRSANQAVAP